MDINLAVHLNNGKELAIEALERAGLKKTGVFQHSVNFRHSSGEPVQLAFDPLFDAMVDREDVELLLGDVPDPDEGW